MKLTVLLLVGIGAAAGAAGQDYAQRYAERCAGCHGADGRSELALTPSLGGQPSFYLTTQLFLFRAGRRDNAAMSAVAKDFSDDDLRGYAEAIAALPAPAASGEPADAARAARGLALAQRHRCVLCHGSDGSGGRNVPRIAGQRQDYLLHALEGYKSGARVGYTPAMNEALATVSTAELADLAYHYGR